MIASRDSMLTDPHAQLVQLGRSTTRHEVGSDALLLILELWSIVESHDEAAKSSSRGVRRFVASGKQRPKVTETYELLELSVTTVTQPIQAAMPPSCKSLASTGRGDLGCIGR